MSVKEVLRVEEIALRETKTLLHRNPHKYLIPMASLYAFSVINCELATTLRSTYWSLRIVDDILDFDRPVPQEEDPLVYASALRRQIETGNYTDESHFSQLTSYAIRSLYDRARPNDNVEQEFINAMDMMMDDCKRAKERRLLTASEIEEYYQTTFLPLINIALIGAESKMRAEDIPKLGSVQARVYSIRDVKEDWEAGLINVPCEILLAGGLDASSSVNEMENSEIVHQWFQEQFAIAKQEVAVVQKVINQCDERLTRILLQVPLNTVSDILKKK